MGGNPFIPARIKNRCFSFFISGDLSVWLPHHKKKQKKQRENGKEREERDWREGIGKGNTVNLPDVKGKKGDWNRPSQPSPFIVGRSQPASQPPILMTIRSLGSSLDS